VESVVVECGVECYGVPGILAVAGRGGRVGMMMMRGVD
jgi:hypothetical protein